MIARIQSIHFDADVRLIQLIENKMNELDHYLSSLKAGQAEVILRLEPVGEVQEKLVELNIRVSGVPIIVKSTGKKFEEAFLKAFKTLKRSILKLKERIQNK
ncbi:MAG: HPF/RaiA family ribosome-associated protein [Saprospiraceae bacterium]|nr:HPF/RaiA family ribosome-associated protein [Saprospiraceae bacterium]